MRTNIYRGLLAQGAVALGLWALLPLGPAAAASGNEVAALPQLHEFILVKVIPGMRQEFMDFLKDEYMPLQRDNEFIKSRKIYLEDAGAEWDFIVIMAYDDYTAFDKSKKRYDELVQKKYPGQAERSKYLKRFQGLVDRHQHMFYKSLPGLSM